jgi:thiosulfate/3-mercaptopyruvate sulfurtransferase
MFRIALAAAAAALLLGSAPIGSPENFCPECWKFRLEAGEIDSHGNCLKCVRPLMVLDTSPLAWFWCAIQGEWRDGLCGDHPELSCCVERGSPALARGRPGEKPFKAFYCPECREFPATLQVMLLGNRCATCWRPQVRAQAVGRTWYWCAGDRIWTDEPCELDPTGKCCSPRTGMLLVAPSGPSPVSPTGITPSALRGEMLVTTDWLACEMDDPDVAIVHVGFPADAPDAAGRAEYMGGHIPGARLLNWSDIAVTRNGLPNEFPPLREIAATVRRLGIDGRHRIVLYDTGSGIEAARAWVALEKVGLGGNAALLDGQWRQWTGEGKAVSVLPAEGEPSEFTPWRYPEVVIGLEEMKDMVWSVQQAGSTVAIVDARPWDEYAGFVAGKGVKRPGHIPGSVHVDCLWNLVASGAPFLRPEEELRALYEEAGVRPGMLVVAYCRTGRQAALTYFTAKLLGYEARLYDGSFVEWSAIPDLRVEQFMQWK